MAEQKKTVAIETRVELKTVPVAYLKPKDINTFSMWHTARMADPSDPKRMHTLEIVGGKIRGLPLATYQMWADAGILTTERPRRRGEDDD